MREVFERIVERCLETGLASAAHVAVDGSFVRAAACHTRCVASAEGLPCEDASRAVREYLTDLESALPDPEGVVRTPPKAVSLTDPGAALSTKHGPAAFAYGLNAMVDTSSGIVLEVQAAPERFADEPIAARRMVERLRDRHEATPGVLTGEGLRLGALPRLVGGTRDRGARAADRPPPPDGRHAHAGRLRLRQGERHLHLPAGRGADAVQPQRGRPALPRLPARLRGLPHQVELHDRQDARGSCRSPHEEVRERVRARQGTPAVRRSMRLRKAVEHLFGHVKHHDGLRRLRLRGLRGADEQFVLAATARNLRRMVRWTALPSWRAAMAA